MSSPFNPGALAMGPGTLYDATLGVDLPDDLATPLSPTDFNPIGYTEEGSELSFEIPTEAVEVAESLDAVAYRSTARNGSVTFAMAEITVRNLVRSFNGGTVEMVGEVLKYTPPEPGDEIRRILVWESEDGQERWVYPQVFQGGSVTMARRKGATKTTLPTQFRLEKPVTGDPIFIAYLAQARSGGLTVAP